MRSPCLRWVVDVIVSASLDFQHQRVLQRGEHMVVEQPLSMFSLCRRVSSTRMVDSDVDLSTTAAVRYYLTP